MQDNQFGFVNTGYKMVHLSLALFSIPDMPFGTMYEQWPWTNSKRTNVPCGLVITKTLDNFYFHQCDISQLTTVASRLKQRT